MQSSICAYAAFSVFTVGRAGISTLKSKAELYSSSLYQGLLQAAWVVGQFTDAHRDVIGR